MTNSRGIETPSLPNPNTRATTLHTLCPPHLLINTLSRNPLLKPFHLLEFLCDHTRSRFIQSLSFHTIACSLTKPTPPLEPACIPSAFSSVDSALLLAETSEHGLPVAHTGKETLSTFPFSCRTLFGSRRFCSRRALVLNVSLGDGDS
ncbi:hypothetical protein KC333_g114 [Hortaea werneckii]|nr:hypothetical protein KC333_g114 [Hortaea werneckii]